jgi:DNA gyrase subunit A
MKAYPKQGRGAKGVRCHKFLKNEDQIYFAKFVGTDPVVVDESDKDIAGLEIDAKRDGTGKKIKTFVAGAN